jgi:hypothetical protein
MKQSIPAGNLFFISPSEDQEIDDLRVVLKLPAGRRVFRRLFMVGNVLGPSMSAEGRSTEYNEGLRAVGIWLATKIETAAPGELARLMLESGNDRLAANAKTNRSKEDG